MEGVVLTKHLCPRRTRVLIRGELVLALAVMASQRGYLGFTLTTQTGADFVEDGTHDVIEEVVTAHVKISGLGNNTEGLELLLEGLVGVASLRELALELRHLLVAALLELLERVLGIGEIKVVNGDNLGEMGK